MILKLDEQNTMAAALTKASDGEYYEALCLFARVDGYESMLNQIGCLLQMGEDCAATALYRKLLGKYFYTHNCVPDTYLFGTAGFYLRSMDGNELKTGTEVDPKKISADKRLVADYSWPDFFDEDFALAAAPRKNIFTQLKDELREEKKKGILEVHSNEYMIRLCTQMLTALLKGDYQKVDECREEFWSIDTDDEAILEMQLMSCYALADWRTGVRFASKIAYSKHPTFRGITMALEVLGDAEGFAEPLERVALKAMDYADNAPLSDLMRMLRTLCNKISYGDTILQLTDKIYSRLPHDGGCSAYKLCAWAYYNCGQRELAKTAIMNCLRATPWDGTAKTMLGYFNSIHSDRFEPPMAVMEEPYRLYDIPQEVSIYAWIALTDSMNKRGRITAEALPYLACSVDYVRSILLRSGDLEQWDLHAESLVELINKANFDEDVLLDYTRERLSSLVKQEPIDAALVNKLIRSGFRGKLLLCRKGNFSTLNLNNVKNTDPAFTAAYSLCVMIRRVSMPRMEEAYGKLVELGGNPTDRQLAYAMLAIAYPGYDPADEFLFADDDRKLYKRYLRAMKLLKKDSPSSKKPACVAKL